MKCAVYYEAFKTGSDSFWFPDIPKQLNEMHDFISKIYTDIMGLRHELSNRELKKLVTDFEQGIESINLICIKISAKQQVAERLHRKMHISPGERERISREIRVLTEALNRLVETAPMQKFLGKHPRLAEKAYMKLEGEGIDDFDQPESPSEEEAERGFLNWIKDIQWYTGILLFELDEAIKSSL